MRDEYTSSRLLCRPYGCRMSDQLCGIQFALGDIAALALAYRVGVVVGHTLSLFARIETEDAFGVPACGEFSECHSLLVVSCRVL